MRTALPSLIVAGVLFTVTAVGASVIDLTGSDTAPGAGKGEAACAGHLEITHPVHLGHDNNHIVTVSVAGDMTACVGQQMLLEVDLPELAHAYAVYTFTEETELVTLTFDGTTGDFRDTLPTVTDGALVPAGDRLDPIKAKDYGLDTITIADTWA